MTLVALLNARAPIGGPAASTFAPDEVLIGVHTPIEHQCRQAMMAGAERILIRSDVPTPELARMADRLTRETDVPVLLVTELPDLARRVERDDRILMLAERMVVPQDCLDALADAPAPALLVTPTEEATAHFERIDASHVWAGAATLGGETLLGTIDLLGEWDLELTLLRRVVQQSAQRIEVSVERARNGGVAKVTDRSEAERVLEALTASGLGEPERKDGLTLLLAPIGRRLVSLLSGQQVSPSQLGWASGFLAMVGIAAASGGWAKTALLICLLGEAALGLAAGCARVMLRRSPPTWLQVLVKGVSLAVMGIIGGRLADGNVLAMAGVGLPLALIAAQTVAEARARWPISGRLGPWMRLSTAMGLTIVLGGALGGRMVDAFILVALCACGTVSARLLASADNRI